MQIFILRKTQSGLTLSVQEMLRIGPFAQWTMDCKLCLCPSGHSDQSTITSQHNFGQATLAVGLSNNAMQMHKLVMVEAEMVGQVQALSARCMSASCHLSSQILWQCATPHGVCLRKWHSVQSYPMPTTKNVPLCVSLNSVVVSSSSCACMMLQALCDH